MESKVTIGADPEFGFINDVGSIVPPPMPFESQFGRDGCSYVCEIRPSPGGTPEELVKNIGLLFASGYSEWPEVRELKWKSGGMVTTYPIGGHIHIGNAKVKNGGLPDRGRVIQALNRLAAPMLLLTEDKEEAINRRVGSNYGRLSSSQRDQPHGVEWRVPYSWLGSAEEAGAVLSMVYTIAHGMINSEDFRKLALKVPYFDEETFTSCDKTSVLYYAADIIKVIKKAPLYQSYRSMMEPIWDTILSQSIFSYDILKGWDVKSAFDKIALGKLKPVKINVSSDDDSEEDEE